MFLLQGLFPFSAFFIFFSEIVVFKKKKKVKQHPHINLRKTVFRSDLGSIDNILPDHGVLHAANTQKQLACRGGE